MSQDKVLIIAKNLRGAYLACELSGQGYDVTLLNLNFSKEDIIWSDQAFSYLAQEDMSYFQKEFLFRSGDQQVKQGMTYLLEDGPINFLSDFPEQVIEQKGLDTTSIKNWPDRALSNIYQEQDGLIEKKNECYKSILSSYDVEKQLDLCKKMNVQVINEPKELSLIKNEDKSFHLKSDSINTNYNKVITLLSSFELKINNPDLFKLIYKKQIIEPEWVWVKASFKHNFCEALNSAPESFYVLADRDLHWAYSNFTFILRQKYMNELQVWMRWPYHENNNQNYLLEEFQLVKEQLQERIKGLRVEEVVLADDRLDPSYLAPAFLYNKDDLIKFNKKLGANKNIIHLGPEHWGTWNLPHIYKLQFKKTMEALAK